MARSEEGAGNCCTEMVVGRSGDVGMMLSTYNFGQDKLLFALFRRAIHI